MILLIDNYDSFVYNLARYVNELGKEQVVYRNDKINCTGVRQLNPSHIILSPGPGTPDQAGISLDVVKHFSGSIPILGVCLGHQAIAQIYGARIERAKQPIHGMDSCIRHDQDYLFKNLPNPLTVGRYHSLIVSPNSFPKRVLKVTAWSEIGEIMSIRHVTEPVFGVQFHPESILTDHGQDLIDAFLT